ncbi:MAG: disulfide bond formation protein B [Alphaproteobacteria bacterium GM7ARS4]|nr:disulfide bond formation protein B [Alphaproteobacteria bacterium GM7ARS4]
MSRHKARHPFHARLLEPPQDMVVLALFACMLLAYVFFSEHVLGYAPCPLCWYQRYVWFAIIPAALLAFAIPKKPLRVGVSVLLLASFSVALYHAGIEYRWWQGPDTCAGDPQSTFDDLEALRAFLYQQDIVRCDDITWALFGISMAGYNAILSLVLAILIILNGMRPQRHA